MTETPAVDAQMMAALECEDWDRVEELWLEALDAPGIPFNKLLEVRRLLWKEGKKNLASTLLELLVDALEAHEDAAGALAALRDLVRLKKTASEEEVERLEAALVDARSDRPSLARIRDHFKLTEKRRPLATLELMENWLDHDTGTVVEVIGQGVGRVIDINLELENIKVALGSRRPVSVPIGAAGRYIRLLPEGDFLRRKVEAPEELKAHVAENPGEALVEILSSVGNDADVASIKASLEDLLEPSKWNTWWAKARKHPRVISSGSGSRLRYSLSSSAESATELLMTELQAASAGDRLVLARRLAARGEDAATAATEFLIGTLATLEQSQPGLAYETSALLNTLPGGDEAADASRRRVLEEGEPLAILNGIKDRNVRAEALEALRGQHPETWTAVWGEWLLHEETPLLLNRIATELQSAQAEAILDGAIETVFRNHTRHPAQFIWAAESMTEEGCPQAVARRMTPSILEKIPDTLGRKEFSTLRGRAKALLDGGKVAIRLLIDAATSQQATRFAHRVARIDGVEPRRVHLVEQAAAQAQTEADSEPETPVLAASPEAIEGKRQELKQLLEVEIPKTLKGINAAAAEGDLRENFEYHMLRDRQELLSAQAAKLQQDLAVVRSLEAGAADTSRVNIGTVIHLDDEDGQPLQPITILGPWDADVDRRIFANGTELAEGLLGQSIGDQVEVEGRSATITKIEPWKG